MWTCVLQVRHSENQAGDENDDDEDTEDDGSHLLGIIHMYGSEMGMGGC